MPQPRNTVIIGATGFIGKHLIQHLVPTNTHVTALCRTPEKLQVDTPNVRILKGEVTDFRLMADILPSVDIVICCAGTVRGRSYDCFKEGNVFVPKILAKLISDTNPKIKLIHLSSLAARNEEISDYAKSKRDGEIALIESALPNYTIIRPPAVYGPGDRELKPLFDWMKRGFLFRPGQNDARFSLIHVEDLCNYVIHLIQNPLRENRVTEIDDGHDNGYNWSQLAVIAAEVFQRDIKAITVPAPLLRASARTNMLFSRLFGYAPMLTTGKVNELLAKDWVCTTSASQDWNPAISFREGLTRLYESSK